MYCLHGLREGSMYNVEIQMLRVSLYTGDV
jgi:hypothetical protein